MVKTNPVLTTIDGLAIVTFGGEYAPSGAKIGAATSDATRFVNPVILSRSPQALGYGGEFDVAGFVGGDARGMFAPSMRARGVGSFAPVPMPQLVPDTGRLGIEPFVLGIVPTFGIESNGVITRKGQWSNSQQGTKPVPKGPKQQMQ